MSLKNALPSTLSLTSSSSHSQQAYYQPRRPSSGSSSSSNKDADLQCLIKLRNAVKEDPSLHPFVNSCMIYRFAAFHSFDYENALLALKQNCKLPQLHLSLSDNNSELLAQLQTHVLFPLPGLKTRHQNCSVIYMRPSRYTPLDVAMNSSSNKSSKRKSLLLKTSSSTTKNDDTNNITYHPIIDNLCYILNDLSQTKEGCRNGVALIANMEDWTMKNFSQDYCLQFMQALQGKVVPTKVELFLIVNPPKWFGKIYKIMKPMLSKSFSKKTHVIKQQVDAHNNGVQLGDFLMDGYERYLPDEFPMGLASSEEILEDYIDLKRYEDDVQKNNKSVKDDIGGSSMRARDGIRQNC